jgi:hypothetical protein
MDFWVLNQLVKSRRNRKQAFTSCARGAIAGLDRPFGLGSRFSLRKWGYLIRNRFAGTYDADEMIDEWGIHLRDIDLGHMATHAIRCCSWADFWSSYPSAPGNTELRIQS